MANLQDKFLSDLTNSGEQVAVFLINGIKLHGIIDTFDEHVIFLKNAITQMIFKHAVSTVIPVPHHKAQNHKHD